MKDLKIEISGVSGAGSTSLSYLIRKFLKEQGFNVEYRGLYGYPTESELDRDYSDMDKILSKLKDTNIHIVENQEVRTWKMPENIDYSKAEILTVIK